MREAGPEAGAKDGKRPARRDGDVENNATETGAKNCILQKR